MSAERYVNEFGAAASPDGQRLALVARGIASNQWWRKGSSHLDQSELWIMNLDGDPAYAPISPIGSRQVWPMWSGDGRSLFYVSDRGGAENIWTRPASAAGADRRLTSFTDGRVLWPSSTLDGRTIAFERDFGIWTLDTAGGQAHPCRSRAVARPPRRRPNASGRRRRFSDLALSPDGRKVAFIARGDVFAASVKDGGDAARVTDTAALESQPAWAPDSRRLAYVSASPAGQQIRLHDFGANTSVALTSGAVTDLSPVFSPDGKQLAFVRNRKELHVMDLAGGGSDRVIATGILADTIGAPVPAWSPGRPLDRGVRDRRQAVHERRTGARGRRRDAPGDVSGERVRRLAHVEPGRHVHPLQHEPAHRTRSARPCGPRPPRTQIPRRPVPRFVQCAVANPGTPNPGNPNPNPGTPEPRTGEPGNPGTPEPVFAAIRDRLSLVPIGLDVRSVTLSPDGKTAVVAASAAGQTNLYSYSLDDLVADRPVARQITTTSGGKADVAVHAGRPRDRVSRRGTDPDRQPRAARSRARST